MRPTEHLSCRHEPFRLGVLQVVVCPTCRTVEWFGRGRLLAPDEGMAEAFGEFRFVAEVPGLGAPFRRVLVYRPPTAAHRSRLDRFEPHTWWPVSPNLSMCHDGELLLLSPAGTAPLELTR